MTRNTLHTKLFHTNEMPTSTRPNSRGICRGIGSSTIPGLDVKLLNRIRQLGMASTISKRDSSWGDATVSTRAFGKGKRDSDDMRHNAVYCFFSVSHSLCLLRKHTHKFQMVGNQLPSEMKLTLHCHAADPGPVLPCRSNALPTYMCAGLTSARRETEMGLYLATYIAS